MAKAKKLPSGNWRVRATYTDELGVKHTASFTAETAKKAEAQIVMWQAGLVEKDEQRKHPTVREAIDMHIETGRCTGMSPATIRAYVSSAKNAFPELADKKINRLNVRDIQAWINRRAGEVSPKTVKNNVSLLCTVLRANGVRIDFDALRLPPVEREEMQIPNDAQVSAMLRDVTDDDDMYVAISLAALMGLRRSEICAIRWSDITEEKGVAYLSVSKAVVNGEGGGLAEKAPKTKAGRRILVIPDDLYAELKRRRQLRPELVSISPNAVTERYMRIARRLGVPPRFHNLRHYHASVMLREGVPEKDIVSDMGHSSFEMVKRVYGHVMEENRGTINKKMASHASKVIRIATEIATQTQIASNS